jgi:hypothetical protein
MHYQWLSRFTNYAGLFGVRGDAMNFLRGLRHSDSHNIHPSCTSRQERTSSTGQNTPEAVLGKERSRLRARTFYHWFFPIVVLCLLLTGPSPTFGQSTFGSVRGVVQDASGAVVSDTEIVLHSTDENTERKVNADASGNFILENVKAGKYSLQAHHNGFADTLISGISVEARQDLRLTVALNIAEQSTTVQVTSDADQINTENATLDDSKSNIEMTQLPLNNRATTTSPLGALGLSPNVQTDSSGNIALGGASSSMVNFSVDGISTANVRQNGALQDAYPSQEGIAAVKVT